LASGKVRELLMRENECFVYFEDESNKRIDSEDKDAVVCGRLGF